MEVLCTLLHIGFLRISSLRLRMRNDTLRKSDSLTNKCGNKFQS